MIRQKLRRQCLAGLGCILAVSLVVIGALASYVFESVFRRNLETMLPLQNGSLSYYGWVGSKEPAPLFMKFYLWNVTNPKDVTLGHKPIITDIGPFVFQQARYRDDIHFYPNKTVSSRVFKRYFYKPEMSFRDGNMTNVTITTVNIPYLVTASQSKWLKSWHKRVIDRYFSTQSGGLFITKNAHEILLGYEDGALKHMAPLAKFIGNIKMPTKVGLFHNRNNSASETYLVHSGVGNISKFNQLERYRYVTDLGIWSEPWANKVQGTDGSMFHPSVKQDERLHVFADDICRSIIIAFEKTTQVHGIDVLQFSPPEDMMANVTVNPKNKAFCTPNCMDTGVMNISRCREGVPMAISAPHFFGAALRYQDAVIGINPSNDHKTAINIEPRTGFVVKARRLMQINAIIEHDKHFPDLKHIDQLILPLMWLDENGGIDAERAELFKQKLFLPIKIVSYGRYGVMALGVALALVILGCVFVLDCLRSQPKAYIIDDSPHTSLSNNNNDFKNGELLLASHTKPTVAPKIQNNGHVTHLFNSNDSLSNKTDGVELMNKLLDNAQRESDIF